MLQQTAAQPSHHQNLFMKKIWPFTLLCILLLANASPLAAQLPCSGAKYRQLDFWLGEWEVFNKNGQKAGDSKVSAILDSCVLLEEWTSAGMNQGIQYTGKSFNTFNRSTNQWQQTWVDNTGSSIEYLEGKFDNKKIIFQTKPYKYSKDTMAVLKLTFHDLGKDQVKQHGEISKDNGATWVTQYELEYRRK